MNFLQRQAVGLGLGFAKPPKDRLGQVALRLRQLTALEDFLDVVQMTVDMLLGRLDAHLAGREAALADFFHVQLDRQSQ